MRSMLLIAGTITLGATIAPVLHAQTKPRRESPTLMPNPNAPPTRPQAAPAAAPQPAPATAPPAAVAPQSARSARAPVAAFSAGLAMEPYTSEGPEAMQRYVATFTQRLDSAVATLIGVFRNTTGQPLAGAETPAALSQRERDRWTRCRDLHYDLQSYGGAMRELAGDLPEQATVQTAGEALDAALTALQATSGCDDVSSMIAAPDRWTPWASQYQATARTFYQSWYGQVRDVADKNRALVIAMNSTLPAGERMPVPPGVARTAPYVGAGPR